MPHLNRDQYRSSGLPLNLPPTGSTSYLSVSRTITPNRTSSIISDIYMSKITSLSYRLIQPLPLLILTKPSPVATSPSLTASISSSSAQDPGRTAKLAPVSTKAFSIRDFVLSMLETSISTQEYPMRSTDKNYHRSALKRFQALLTGYYLLFRRECP